MTKNLDVVTFRNGDTIPEAKSEYDWWKANEDKKPAWCYYENNDVKGAKYGKLYNWYAVNDKRGLAPLGWKFPSQKEWETLIEFVGGVENPMKLISGNDWLFHNITNETGFSALPGGNRWDNGYFTGSMDDENYAKFAVFWTSSEREDLNYLAYQVQIGKSAVHLYDNKKKGNGASLRCIKE